MTMLGRLVHRARTLAISLTTSLWFIPGMIVGLSIALAFLLVMLSERIDAQALAGFPRLFGVSAAGSRDMLSTIAGSIITVAGVTFSITIAALALASAQYTPRVLRTFMSDKANQVVLGTFVGIYSYCLVILRTIRGREEGVFVPSIAVLGGFLLALVGVGVLIFFIHHIAVGLQVSIILDRVRRVTERAIAHRFPELATDATDATDDDPPTTIASAAGGSSWQTVAAERTGYVQAIDRDGLISLAREQALAIRLEREVGDFVTAGAPLISIARVSEDTPSRATGAANAAGASAMPTRSLSGLLTIDTHRTVEQDPSFGAQQIVDIALKALSPGVNDTTTAVMCVDHLGAILARVAERRLAPRQSTESDGPRLIGGNPTFASLVALALDDIRRNARGNVTVLDRLIDAIESIAPFARHPGRRRVLVAQIDKLADAAIRWVDAPSDRAQLVERAGTARKALVETTLA